MPTYSYACKQCDHRFDVQQSFTDDALTECPACAGTLRKLFSAVGVVFKGGGFYRTDSRSSTSGSDSSSSGGDSSSSGKGDGSSTSTAASEKKSAAPAGASAGSTKSSDGSAA